MERLKNGLSLINFKKVIVGQGLNTGPTQFAMARRFLMGDTLSQFNQKANELKEKAVLEAAENTTVTNAMIEMVANLEECFNAVTKTVLPPKALQTQKRYMRRMLRKPQGMKIRDYFGRYIELNNYLKMFPPPPPTKKMPMDEILEHAEFAIPSSWQRQFVLQGFNAVTCPMEEFIEFCERLELSESIYDNTHKSNVQSDNKCSEEPWYKFYIEDR